MIRDLSGINSKVICSHYIKNPDRSLYKFKIY